MAGASKRTASPDVGNTVYNSPYRKLAWDLIRNGMPIPVVRDELEEKGLKVTPPVLHNFKAIMEDFERQQGNSDYYSSPAFDPEDPTNIPLPSPQDVPDDMRIKNDGEVLDMLILQFSNQLRNGEVNVTPAVALKAMDMKKSMLGPKYRGQTIWGLMESQMQIDKLLEIMNRHITHDQFEAIIAEMESEGVVSTQRPKALSSVIDLDAEITKEVDKEIKKELDDPSLRDGLNWNTAAPAKT